MSHTVKYTYSSTSSKGGQPSTSGYVAPSRPSGATPSLQVVSRPSASASVKPPAESVPLRTKPTAVPTAVVPDKSQVVTQKTAVPVQAINGSELSFMGARGVRASTMMALNQSESGKRGFSGTQRYATIKDRCLKSQTLFEDPEFPADDKSIGIDEVAGQIVWKRAKDLSPNPKLFEGGASRFDIVQGELGDCWLLAATACLSLYPELLNNVIPQDQEFDNNYCGAFRFHLWNFGKWVEVVVDDRLPTKNGELIFMHSKASNEFWSALIEKAYAKITGDYNSLKGGSVGEAFEDFTGGVLEYIDLTTLKDQEKKDLYPLLLTYRQRYSLMGCSIKSEEDSVEDSLENGLVIGHAYSITAVKELKTSAGTYQLVRCRNPWGEKEWNGDWSDNSPLWKKVSEKEKKDSEVLIDDDGEFWICWKDFLENFTTLEICHIAVDSFTAEQDIGSDEVAAGGTPVAQMKKFGKQVLQTWSSRKEFSSWRKNVNAGGCRNFLNTFWTNPQYHVELTTPDTGKNEALLVVGLMQRSNRKERAESGEDLLSIGFMVYEGTSASGLLDKRYFETHKAVAKTEYINLREMTGRFHLKLGQYVIVPSTYDPNTDGDFMLRIFSEKANIMEERDEVSAIVEVPPPSTRATDAQAEFVKTLNDIWPLVSGPKREVNAFGLRDIIYIWWTGDRFKPDPSRPVPKEVLRLNEKLNTMQGLRPYKFTGVSLETCRAFVALFDYDCDGKMSLDEFIPASKLITRWMGVFQKFDTDNSGTLNTNELRDALNTIGFKLSNKNFNCVVQRYAEEDGTLNMDAFTVCAARLHTIFESFSAQKKGASGKAEFDLEEFSHMMIYS